MKPETLDTFAAADRDLVRARGNYSLGYWDQAARLAYYARFHAAQAMVFERAGIVAKTHKGVHIEFHRLALAEPALAPGLAAELSQAYKHKEIADYDTGTSSPILATQADSAITSAERFVAAVRQVLAAT